MGSQFENDIPSSREASTHLNHNDQSLDRFSVAVSQAYGDPSLAGKAAAAAAATADEGHSSDFGGNAQGAQRSFDRIWSAGANVAKEMHDAAGDRMRELLEDRMKEGMSKRAESAFKTGLMDGIGAGAKGGYIKGMQDGFTTGITEGMKIGRDASKFAEPRTRIDSLRKADTESTIDLDKIGHGARGNAEEKGYIDCEWDRALKSGPAHEAMDEMIGGKLTAERAMEGEKGRRAHPEELSSVDSTVGQNGPIEIAHLSGERAEKIGVGDGLRAQNDSSNAVSNFGSAASSAQVMQANTK